MNVEMIEYRIVRINENWDECRVFQTNIPENVGTLERWNVGTTKQLLVQLVECQNKYINK